MERASETEADFNLRSRARRFGIAILVVVFIRLLDTLALYVSHSGRFLLPLASER